MVELFSLDDVGQCYDIALSEADRVNVTVGRHTNDFMTSFTPNAVVGHDRCGRGGREIDPANWQPSKCTMARACGDMSASGCRLSTAK